VKEAFLSEVVIIIFCKERHFLHFIFYDIWTKYEYFCNFFTVKRFAYLEKCPKLAENGQLAKNVIK